MEIKNCLSFDKVKVGMAGFEPIPISDDLLDYKYHNNFMVRQIDQ